jgi:uncharacterized membrane protein (UPF0182 family)
MPQLKKLVLAMGDRLIYRDTFDQALADLTRQAPPPVVAGAQTPPTAASQNHTLSLAERIHQLRDQAEQMARELDNLEKETVKK